MIRILSFTTLFPNLAQPTHGVFVENRLRHLILSTRVTNIAVVAPVPWFPAGLAPLFPGYAKFAFVPHEETRGSLHVIHPRYPVIPKIGMTLAPALLCAWCLPVVRRMQRQCGDFDLIDAHYVYPDGLAAVMIGKIIGKPVVVTARGTDINLIPRYRLPREFIRWAAKGAAGLIAVSQALKDEMTTLGIDPARITTLRNGVDLEMFRPFDRRTERAKLGLSGATLVSVGALIPRKGHDLIISALALLPRHSLLIVGEGPEGAALEQLAKRLGVANRVRFLGRIDHRDLAPIYSAADALVLASSREGWPNVLLEAMACGTPVVASNIWGNPEVVTRPEAGVLMKERSVEGVAAAVNTLFARLPDRALTRSYAEDFSWDETSQGQIRLFERILGRSSTPP